MAFDKKKFIGKFIEDAREHVSDINDCLLKLEKNPEDVENLNSVFRAVHTIKGAARMMKLTSIADLSHKLEDALDALRGGKIAHTKELLNLFFSSVDIISDMVEKTVLDCESLFDIKDICEKLDLAVKNEQPPETQNVTDEETSEAKETVPAISEPQNEVTTPEPVQPTEKVTLPETQSTNIKNSKLKPGKTIRVETAKLDETIKLMGEILSYQSRLKQRVIDIKEIEKLSKKNMELVSLSKTSPDNKQNNEIINTANSLYLKLKTLVSNSKDDAIFQELQAIELQEKSLRMRMMPISTVFEKFQREVRDIATLSGKQIDLVIEGGETELDKTIIEKMGDPLLHMIKNSIDHGIEKPDERLSAGKSANGTLRLSAYYESGLAVIEVADDGTGIPIDKIKEKAVQKNIVDENDIENMPLSALIDLIFHPGFSTSSFITDISGRGVGMDVVKKNIVEDLRGSINVDTKPGKGTTFFIRLPLTLSIMHVLQLTVSDMIFAISANYITEILKVPESEIIDVVGKTAIRLREKIVPVARLNTILNIPDKNNPGNGELLIIMITVGNEMLGLIVDTLIEEEYMVIKPLPSHMKDLPWVTGASISGKNEIVSILNIPHIIGAVKEMKKNVKLKSDTNDSASSINILVADDSLSTREIEKSILESYGYNVEVADDGMDALEKADDFKYDLVVTDIEMPRMDGFTLVENLRKKKEYKHTPIIILTSLEKEADKRRGMQVGADAYISKGSFDQSNLLETVQNLIS